MDKLYFRKETCLVSEFPSEDYRSAHNNTAGLVGLTTTPKNPHYEVIDKIHNYFQNQENTTSEGSCSKCNAPLQTLYRPTFLSNSRYSYVAAFCTRCSPADAEMTLVL